MQMKAKKEIEVSTPLGDGVLLFRSMTVTEELGRLFECDLQLLSKDHDLKLEDLLGQKVTVRLLQPDGKVRFFNGFVNRFAQTGVQGHYVSYRAKLVPWLWFLTRTADCRIFQEKSAPDVIKEVFREHGFTDFEESLSATYESREYCVQYRETDFNFVSRLMESEGIYYYFKHEEDKHTLVLADSYSAHQAVSGYEEVPFFPPGDNVVREEHVFEWGLRQEVQTGVYALTDYDFEKPRADLQVKTSIDRGHPSADLEIFDYPGGYVATDHGNTRVRTRIEELHAQYERLEGKANARGFFAGALFKLEGCPRDDVNREFLLVRLTHQLELDAYESGKESAGPSYACEFKAIDSQQPYRTPRKTPKPRIRGPQTALVVGKQGEEIWTDKYGRVKLQFPWDRYGKSDENSSRWVRVSQVWAGKGWGAMHIPRMGQEVVVEYLEGDPDQPIITGRVYNADNMPTYDLPANQTRSGLMSRSTKKGNTDTFNEIRFEDKKDEEELYIHAEKDQTRVIENNDDFSVGANQNVTIGNDRTEKVGKNETVEIGETRKHTIGKDDSLTVGANHTVSVTSKQDISVGEDRSLAVGKNSTFDVGEKSAINVGKEETLKVGKKLTIDVGDQVSFKCGSSSILLKKDGTVEFKGKDIKIQGSGKITLKASKDVIVKGKTIKQN
jgi:type VI secretion system secreted protein VgrG